jgi:hypothetical protein
MGAKKEKELAAEDKRERVSDPILKNHKAAFGEILIEFYSALVYY